MIQFIDLTCSTCQHSNPPDALNCRRCSTPLRSAKPAIQSLSSQPRPYVVHDEEPSAAVNSDVQITLRQNGHTLRLSRGTSALIGWGLKPSDAKKGEQLIDLARFFPVNQDVERRHILVFPTDSQYVLCDLNTRSGTWVNNYWLQPGCFTCLSDRNEVLIGGFSLKITIPLQVL